MRIIEEKFYHYIEVEDENLDLKFSLLKFYKETSFNKIKIMQVISNLEKEQLSLAYRIKIYQIKRYISDADVV